MNYYEEIKNKLTEDAIYSKAKDYSKERHRVETYFEVGKMLSEAGKHYGENIIGQYSIKLKKEVDKKYNKRTLFRMRQFYILFGVEKVSPVVTQLNWSHYLMLLSFKDSKKINYYINQVVSRNLSKRQLQDIIKSKEYERLPEETKEKLISNNVNHEVTDYIKNPIVIKSDTKDKEQINEKILQRLILEDIPSFLKELGDGFTFVENEYKIKIGEAFNYIDILLFNYIFNAFIVVELKVVPLKKEHIGQIEVYMNYIDKHVKNIIHNKTIGLIITRKNNKFILEYASDKRILAKEYKII